MNNTLQRRIASLEARTAPPTLPRIVRVVVDVDREPMGAVCRPGHHLIDRQPGEPLQSLVERAEASR